MNTKRDTDKTPEILLGLIKKGFQKIWRPRNQESLNKQKLANIHKKDKNPNTSKFRQKHVESADTISVEMDDIQPTVIIDNSHLQKKFDAFRCTCGLHSLLHSPGRGCQVAGLVIHRAGNIALSAIRS
jgi:hypothetical protein